MTETGRKEHWEPGETAFFEYHCLESMDSNDSDLWLRSHSKVEVFGEADWEKEFGEDKTIEQRHEAGMPKVYRVRFSDGHEGAVFEDELYTSAEYWHRDNPPAALKEKHEIDVDCLDGSCEVNDEEPETKNGSVNRHAPS